MSGHRRAAAHATFWGGMEVFARYGIQVVVMAVLARLLRPDDFGLISMVLVFTALGTLFVDAGLGISLIQKQRTSPDDETTAFLTNLAISLFAACVLALGAPLLAGFYGQPELAPLTRFMSLTFPLAALATVPDAILTQRMAFSVRARIELGTSISAGSLGALLAYHGFGAWSLAWQSVASIGSRSALLWLVAHWRPRGRFRTSSLRELFGFGGYMLVANVIDTTYTRLQALLIGKLFSPRELGFFTLAQNTQQVPTTFVSATLNRIGLPLFAAMSDDVPRMVVALRRALILGLFLFAPLMVSLAIASQPLVHLVFGPGWAPAATLLQILSLAGILWPWHVLNLVALNATGRSDLVLRIEVVKKSISIVMLILASRWGPVGIAWAVVAASVLALLFNGYYARILLGYSGPEQMRDLAPIVAMLLAASIAGWGVSKWLPFGEWQWAARLGTFLVAYIAIALAARYQAVRELTLMLATWQRGVVDALAKRRPPAH